MTPALAALLALAPGILVWWWARRLVRSATDPALPERVHAWRRRSIAAAATGTALLLVFLPSQLAWALPLLLLGFLAGGFPMRRGLFGETWSLGSYLFHTVRAIVAFAGFWVVAMAAPALISATQPWRWATATVLAGVLLAWGLLHDRILLRLLRAVALDRPDLEPRLIEIASRSTAPMPRLFTIGSPGGRWANGLALPSTGQPAVAFTRTLLEKLDADEIAAIFAHEQAHLEHYDRRRVIRLAVIQATVVLLGTLGAAAVLSRFESSTLAVTAGWPLVMGLALVFRLARHQAHEADSDRRAAELCGDPDALARGLVKLHELALFPRRLELEHEQWESHPSLASRLRALRMLAGQGPDDARGSSDERSGASPSAGVPVCLAGESAGAWLVLEEGQAHWLESVPEDSTCEPASLRAAASRARTLAYAELVELRLEPRGDRHRVVATDRAGASWNVNLAPGESQAAQDALDAIDARLSPTSAAPRGYRPIAALVAAAGALAALLTLSAAAVPGLVAVFLTHPGPLAALGTALVVSALASPPDSAVALFEGIPESLLWAALLALGAAALVLAGLTTWRERAGRTRSAPWTGLFLSLAAAFPLLPVVTALVAGSALALHLATRQHPAGTILLAGAAAAFLVSPRRWSRVLGVVAALLAAVPLIVASGAFADRFVHDPLWVKDPPPLPSPVALRLLAEHPLPASSTALSLSPSGRSFLTRGYDPGGDAAPRERLVVGAVGGPRHPRVALDVTLLDDDSLLALEEGARGLALVCEPHDPSEPEVWRHALPALVSPRLAADQVAGVWRVVGIEPNSGELIRLVGNLDGQAPREDRWPAADLAGQWLVSAGPAALGVGLPFEDDWDNDELSTLETVSGLWWLLAGLPGGGGATVFTLDARGPRALWDSQLMVQCDEPPPAQRVFVCRAHAGERTALWSINPLTGGRDPLGVIEGFATPPQPAAQGGLVLTHAGRRQELYRLGPEGPVRLDRPETSHGSRWILDVAGFTEGVGALEAGDDGRPRLRLYTWDPGVAAP